jgi:hypothetical protein
MCRSSSPESLTVEATWEWMLDSHSSLNTVRIDVVSECDKHAGQRGGQRDTVFRSVSQSRISFDLGHERRRKAAVVLDTEM